MQEYDARVAAAVQREASAILADLPTAQRQVATPKGATVTIRREAVREILQNDRRATGEAVHKALLAAGFTASLRTAYSDRDVVLAAMG